MRCAILPVDGALDQSPRVLSVRIAARRNARQPKREAMKYDESAHGERGSEWHLRDSHIHTPGTVLNDRYPRADPWDALFTRVNCASAIRTVTLAQRKAALRKHDGVRRNAPIAVAGERPNGNRSCLPCSSRMAA